MNVPCPSVSYQLSKNHRVFRFSSFIFTSFQNVGTWRSAPNNLKWDCTLYVKLRKSIPGWRGWVQRTTRLTSHQHRPNPGLAPGATLVSTVYFLSNGSFFFFFSESQRMGNCSYKYIFLKVEKEKKSAHQTTIAIENDPTEWLLVNWRESHIVKKGVSTRKGIHQQWTQRERRLTKTCVRRRYSISDYVFGLCPLYLGCHPCSPNTLVIM